MSFSNFEVSPDSGSPVELYLFELGGARFAYTNAESDIVFESVTYVATPVSRSRLIQSIENSNQQLNVILPGDNVFARLFIGVIPGEFPTLVVRQLHTNDPDDEAIFVFDGFVSTVGFSNDNGQADLACRPTASASGRTIPRHTFQGLCNHTLYDSRCTQDEADYEELVQVESVDDRVITIASGELSTEAAGYWLAGFIQFNNEYRQIIEQSGRVMTVDIPFFDDPTSSNVRILPGCDHVIDGDCENTFSSTEATAASPGNTINHGGYPYVSTKNPFEGLD